MKEIAREYSSLASSCSFSSVHFIYRRKPLRVENRALYKTESETASYLYPVSAISDRRYINTILHSVLLPDVLISVEFPLV